MSSQEQVDIVARADTAAAYAQMKQIASGFGEIERAGQKAQVGAKSLFDFTGGSVAKLTMQVLGISTALQAVNRVGQLVMAEYNNFLEKNRVASGVQLSFGEEMRKVGQMLGGDVGKLGTFRQGFVNLTKQTGVPSAQLAAAFAETVGAGSNVPPEQVYQAISAAARFRPGPRTDSSTLHSLARGILGIQSSFPGTTTDQALAGVQSFMAADPTTNIEKFTQNMLPGVLMAATEGDTFQDTAAMFAGVSQRAHDWWGRTTRNNMINFLTQIRAKTAPFLPGRRPDQERFAFLRGTPQGQQIVREMLGPAAGVRDPERFFQQDNVVARGVTQAMFGAEVGDLRSEAKFVVPFQEFLRGLMGESNETTRRIASARRNIYDLGDPRAMEQARRIEAAIQADPSQQVLKIDRAVGGATEAIRIEDTVAGITGTYRERLPELLQSAGVGSTKRSIAMGVFDVQSALADEPREIQNAAIAAISAAKVRAAEGRIGTQFNVREPELTTEQQRTNAKLDELIEVLKQGTTIKIEAGGEHLRGTSAAERAGQ